MSSFWNLFGGSKDAGEEKPQETEAGAQLEQSPQLLGSLPAALPAPSKKPSVPPPPALPPKPQPRYGIDDAIKLMRSLPVEDNVELIVRVVRRTLESLSVKVTEIIEDASQRQEALRGRIGEYKGHISEFEREIELRRQEIAKLEEQLAETTTVRERLELTESIGPTPVAPDVAPRFAPTPAPPGASRPPPDKRFEPSPMSRNAPPVPYRPKLGASANPPAEKKPSIPPPPATPIPGEDAEPIGSGDFEKS